MSLILEYVSPIASHTTFAGGKNFMVLFVSRVIKFKSHAMIIKFFLSQASNVGSVGFGPAPKR